MSCGGVLAAGSTKRDARCLPRFLTEVPPAAGGETPLTPVAVERWVALGRPSGKDAFLHLAVVVWFSATIQPEAPTMRGGFILEAGGRVRHAAEHAGRDPR